MEPEGAEGQEARTSSPGVDLSQFECSVCLNLLVDPIVGNCGHDFCRSCLDKWQRSERRHGRAVRCPVCRGVFADTSFEKLGVCVRLRETIEVLFPERSAARRKEVSGQRALEAQHAAAEVSEEVSPGSPQPSHTQSSASPSPTRRRVHALRRHAAAGSSSAATSSRSGARGSRLGSPVTVITAGGDFPAAMVAAAAGGEAGGGLWGVLQQQLQGAAAAASHGAAGGNGVGSSGGSSQAAWPGEGLIHVNFTMGWHAATPGREKRRGRARRIR